MPTSVPFVDLSAQYAAIKPEIDAAIAGVLADRAFILGPHVAAFEAAFAKRLGVADCVGCASGTSALTLALDALGIGPGDEVITVAHTFFATAEAILGIGATPVFVDIDPRTHGMDPTAVEAAITPRTKALLPVHIYGGPCAMSPLLALARRHGLRVIEDSAQAHLATYDGQCAGTLGDIGCFSFYPGKNLGAYGDAGALVTNDPALAARARASRDHGRTGKYEHGSIGHNHRMDGLQGAVLSVKLPHLDAWTAARRRLAALYDGELGGHPALRPVAASAGAEPVYHLYVVELAEGIDRAALRAALADRGVETGVHYPIPCHRQPALAPNAISLPVTERVAGRVLSLPMFPELTEDQARFVAKTLLDLLPG